MEHDLCAKCAVMGVASAGGQPHWGRKCSSQWGMVCVRGVRKFARAALGAPPKQGTYLDLLMGHDP